VRGIHQQVHKHNLEELGVPERARRFSVNPDLHLLERRIATEEARRGRHQRPDVHDRQSWLRRTGKQQQVLHQLVERVDPLHDFGDDRRILAALRQTRPDDLYRGTHAGQGILHFVGNHGRHLTELRQRRLFAQLLLHPDTRAQIVQNPGEALFAAHRHLSDRQVQRKRGAVATQTCDLPARPDDLLNARREMAGQIGVVLVVVG